MPTLIRIRFHFWARGFKFLAGIGLRCILVAALMAQGPLSMAADTAPMRERHDARVLQSVILLAQASQNFSQEPFVKDFLQQPGPLPALGFTPETLDENPFLMHGQRWSFSEFDARFERDPGWLSLDEDAVAVRSTPDSTEIHMPRIRRSLEIRRNLRAVGLVDDFVILMDPVPMVSGLTQTEGLWYISLREIYLRSATQGAVPVHFFPLPSLYGQVQRISADLVTDQLIFEIAGAPSWSMDLQTLRTLKRWQDLVLLMSQAQCLLATNCRGHLSTFPLRSEDIAASVNGLLPPKGSVAGNGMIPVWSKHVRRSATSWMPQIQRWLWPRAEALEQEHLATAERVFWLMSVMGSLLLVSAVAQGTVLREKLTRIGIGKDIDRFIYKYEKSLRKAERRNDRVEADRAQLVLQSLRSLKRQFFLAITTVSEPERSENLELLKRSYETFRQTDLGGQADSFRFLGLISSKKLRDMGDVFAHMMTTIGNFAAVTTGNALEYFGDRWVPFSLARDNALLRRLLRGTFLFSREVATSNAVSGKTFWLGGLVSGSIDTASLAVQYLVVVPAIGEWAKPSLSPEAQRQIEIAFDFGHSESRIVMEADIYKTFLNALQLGASEYAANTRGFEIPIAAKAVESELRAIGKDPLAPANQALVKKLMEDKISRAIVAMGLPDANQFLFDINSIYRQFWTETGYGAVESGDRDRSVLFRRSGLSPNVLARSVRMAETMVKKRPDAANMDALAALRSLQSDFHFFSAIVKRPAKDAGYFISLTQRMFRARRALTLLSFEGPVDKVLEIVPEIWQERSAEGVRRANQIFRFALHSYTSGVSNHRIDDQALVHAQSGPTCCEPGPTSPSGYLGQAYSDPSRVPAELRAIIESEAMGEEARTTESESSPSEVSLTNTPESHSSTAPDHTSHSAEADEHDRPLRRSKGKDRSFISGLKRIPRRMDDWYRRLQLARAEKAAAEAVASQGIAPGQAQFDLVYMGAFRERLAKAVSLSYTSDAPHVLAALREADSAVALAKQQPFFQPRGADTAAERFERLKLLAQIHSLEFLRAYKVEVVDREAIAHDHPDQPGYFQTLRRTDFVKGNRFWTNFLRFWEASFEENRFTELGLWSFMDRKIPGWFDLRTSLLLTARYLPEKATSSYWMSTGFWHISISWSSYTLMALLLWTVLGPMQYLNRLFKHLGYRPMNNFWSRAQYITWFSWITFWGIFPLLFYNETFSEHTQDIPELSAYAGGAALTWLLVREWLQSRRGSGRDPVVFSSQPEDGHNKIGRSSNRPDSPVNQPQAATLKLCSDLF